MMRAIAIVILVASAGCTRGHASPIAIAGSHAAPPPTFLQTGFVGMTPLGDTAFSFSLLPEGSFQVEELQIALSYSSVFGANSGARLSIHDDADGVPGAEIGAFEHASVPTTPGVVVLTSETSTTLQSGVRYWIVGNRTESGQVNVHISDTLYGLYGPVARRSQDGDWVGQQFGSLPAFILYGSQVPEPAAGTLLLVASAGLFACRRQRHELR